MTSADLRRAVARVVQRDNCSGCGACAALSPAISMELDADGYARPVWQETTQEVPSGAAKAFRHMCPGVRVRSARNGTGLIHSTLGPYVSAWQGWAGDPDVRFAGSSGGVLTALTAWLLQSGTVHSVTGAAMSAAAPNRTVALELRTREQVVAAAGSRYAPVSNAQLFGGDRRAGAFVGKPCEAYAVRKLSAVEGAAPAQGGIILSFFCAGVPSQRATDDLVRDLGSDPEHLASLRYRGNGWPGSFTAVNSAGAAGTVSYEESWGKRFGPAVQSRCKICPDGVGEHADIAVGDYWRSDPGGFPTFTESAGCSVIIARTPRGHQLLMSAAAAGILELGAVDLDAVASMQPLQVKRLTTLAGRLVGRLLAGQINPRFSGFALLRRAASRPRSSFAALVGSRERTVRLKRKGSAA